MPHDNKQRRRAEHARRRRLEAAQVREQAGDPSEFVKEIRARKGASQNADDAIFGIPLTEIAPMRSVDDLTTEEIEAAMPMDQVVRESIGRQFDPLSAELTVEREQEIADGIASIDEQESFVRALKRKFQATEREPDSGIAPVPQSAEPDENRKCALCRRQVSGMNLGTDGRLWCPEREAAACMRIAQGRLGGATTSSRSALSGKLKADGDCRRCGVPIKWVKTQRGKKMPVDVDPAPPSVDAFELIGQVDTLAFFVSEKKRPTFAGDVYRSHFQTCEARDET